MRLDEAVAVAQGHGGGVEGVKVREGRCEFGDSCVLPYLHR